MSGLIPLFSDKDVKAWFSIFQDQAEEKFLKALQYAGEYFVKIARSEGRYIDHTGNLRSSVGYAIVKEGKMVQSDFAKAGKGSDQATGQREGEKLVRELAQIYNSGYVLIGMAGMEYAVSVEAIEGKDVISGSTERVMEILELALEKALKDVA